MLGADFGGHSSNVWDIEESEATRDLTIDEIRQQQQMAIQGNSQVLISAWMSRTFPQGLNFSHNLLCY